MPMSMGARGHAAQPGVGLENTVLADCISAHKWNTEEQRPNYDSPRVHGALLWWHVIEETPHLAVYVH